MCFRLNSLRLWVPQLFNIIFEYQNDFPQAENAVDLCTMIEHKVNKSMTLSYSSNPATTAAETVTGVMAAVIDPVFDSSFVAMEEVGLVGLSLSTKQTCEVVRICYGILWLMLSVP